MGPRAQLFQQIGGGSRVCIPCLAMAVLMYGQPSPLSAQPALNSIGGLPAPLPVLPTSPGRTFDGGSEMFLPTAPQTQVNSFIESLKGNDGAFQVIVGQGRLLTLKEDIASEDASAVIAVGDPSIADFKALPNPRLIRVLGLRPGVTDLSVTTADDETVSLEVHVTYDLTLLEARLRQLFPGSHLKLAQLREHLIVEGQVRSNSEATRIMEILEAYVESMQVEIDEQSQITDDLSLETFGAAASSQGEPAPLPAPSGIELGGIASARAQVAKARVINLMRVPGVQQVLLKVRIAELDRTAMRAVGADMLGVDPSSGNIFGTRIGGAAVSALGVANPVSEQGMAALTGLFGTASAGLGTSSSAFGIFPSSDFQIILHVLRQNGFLRILAEPNLITMSGHRASFLAGGEFPVPVPQSSGGVSNAVTVDFREFGVRLDFLPFVIDDERIRLSVTPEVSTIDRTLGTTLVVGGEPVPGLSTRRANTTVELRPGQTLALAGLLQVELDGQTSRIPGLGDLPYLGPLFSNTSHRRVEKELVVLVTPQLVQPIEDGDSLPLPGESVQDPTDVELYLKNRYEGHTGVNHRSTVEFGWCNSKKLIYYEKRFIPGPVGFGE